MNARDTDREEWRRRIASATGKGVGLLMRGTAMSAALGVRWAQRTLRGAGVPDGKRTVSVSLLAKHLLDDLFFASEIASMTIVSFGERERLVREISESIEFFDRNGWLDAPGEYHRDPLPIEAPEATEKRTIFGAYRHMRFESCYAPHEGEPGRERWLGYEQNHTAHAWLLEHPGGPRPWVVCVPGYRMGHPIADLLGFRARWLHSGLGLNVAIPVLPLHGPRTVGRRGGDGFLAGDFVDTIHAQAQAIRDIRSLIAWVRDRHRAPRVAAYGLSLGGYTAALLASIESNLDAVIVGIPATDFVSLLREHMPERLGNLLERHGFPFQDLQLMMRVVSPLAMAPRLPVERRTLYAARADGLAVPSQALALGEHWDQPEIKWLAGTHVSAIWDREVEKVISDALCRAGLTERSHGKDAAAYAVGLSPGLLSAPA
jgi:hypothetical protein